MAKIIQYLIQKGFSTAYAALGYHAFEIEKNKTKAALFWLQGWETKRDIDCAFNLGYLWSEGLFLNESKNLVIIHVNKHFKFI